MAGKTQNMMNFSVFNNVSSSQQLEPCHILRPLGVYLLILWIIGTILNGSILYIFLRYRQLRQSSTNIFIGGLIFADFLGTCFEIPLPAIALLGCRWIFAYVGCVLQSIIAYFAGCSNMYMLCLISIDRYFLVTRSFSTTTLTIKQTYITIVCAYILALFWTLMPVIGWSSYDFEGTGASCSIKWEDHSLNVVSYNMTIFVFVYLLPVCIIIITNINSLKMIYHQRQSTDIRLSRYFVRRQLSIERRVGHTMIFIIGGFLLAWTPYAVTVFIRVFIDGRYFSPIAGTIPAIFAKTSFVWNPFIYVVRNGNFRLYLPLLTSRRYTRRRSISNPTRFSMYPHSAVHLPLPSRPAFRENPLK